MTPVVRKLASSFYSFGHPRIIADTRNWRFLGLYGLAFVCAHWAAQAWGGQNFYSLWYPAAGLRLAVLWLLGARWALPCAIAELLADMATGTLQWQGLGADLTWAIYAALAPPLAYGIAIAAVRALCRKSSAIALSAPMRLGLAAVAAPFVAMASLVPQAIMRPDMIGIADTHHLIASLTSMGLGDLLGVLTFAPPIILVVTGVRTGKRDWVWRLERAQVSEIVLVLLGAFGLVAVFWHGGLSFQTTPLLMAVAWIGLRYGRVVAWCALTLINMIILPFTTLPLTAPDRIQWHLGLAAVMIMGYLAGSYADAGIAAKAALDRRNRLLLQAERLKTLRAMSVSLIHEISQPLTTLAIEARHLRRISSMAEDELALSAQRIDSKAQGIATLVKRLRRFGERGDDNPARVSVSQLLDMASELTASEFKANGVKLHVANCLEELIVFGQEIELTQALINLLRNALVEAGDQTVELAVERQDQMAVISVRNPHRRRNFQRDGMGLGLIIARIVVEAYGGQLDSREENDRWLASIRLPLATRW